MSIMASLVIAIAGIYVFWKDYIPDLHFMVIASTMLYLLLDLDTYRWYLEVARPETSRQEMLYIFLWIGIAFLCGKIVVILLDQLRKVRPVWVAYLIAGLFLALTNTYFLRLQAIMMLVLAGMFVCFLIWYDYRIEHSKPNQNP